MKQLKSIESTEIHIGKMLLIRKRRMSKSLSNFLMSEATYLSDLIISHTI